MIKKMKKGVRFCFYSDLIHIAAFGSGLCRIRAGTEPAVIATEPAGPVSLPAGYWSVQRMKAFLKQRTKFSSMTAFIFCSLRMKVTQSRHIPIILIKQR